MNYPTRTRLRLVSSLHSERMRCLAIGLIALLWASVSGRPASWGGVDSSFEPGGGNRGGFDSDVTSLAVQPDGGIVVAGTFLTVGTIDRSGIARVLSDGSLDTSFDPGFGLDRYVETVAIENDGRILVGGWFGQFDGQAKPYLVRLEADGALAPGFSPAPNDFVLDFAVQPDGCIVMVGVFTTVGGVPRPHVARLNHDGTVDMSFNPGIGTDDNVYCLALQTDGKILLGGDFTSVNGVARARLARLNPDGSVDLTFDPGEGCDRLVYDLEVQPDGKIVVGGWFEHLGGQPRIFLGRLLENGALDATFQPQIDLVYGEVLTVRCQPDGKILAAGQFNSVGGVPRNCIARFMTDGQLDADFDPGEGPVEDPKTGLKPMIREIALQADGHVLAAGRFIEFDGTRVNRLVRLMGDQGGAISWVEAFGTVTEGEAGLQIQLRRSGSTAGPVSVGVGVVGGSADPQADCILSTNTVVFGAGELGRSISLSALPDALLEGSEDLTLALGNVLGGELLGAQQQMLITITDGSPVPVRSEISQIELWGEDRIRVTVECTGTVTYQLEASQNVEAWTPVADGTGPGTASYDLPRSTAEGSWLYRVRQ